MTFPKICIVMQKWTILPPPNNKSTSYNKYYIYIYNWVINLISRFFYGKSFSRDKRKYMHVIHIKDFGPKTFF